MAEYMSIGEAAKFLGISRDTLRRWEKRGRLKAFRSPTNRRYYTENQLKNLMSGSPQPINTKSRSQGNSTQFKSKPILNLTPVKKVRQKAYKKLVFLTFVILLMIIVILLTIQFWLAGGVFE